MALKVILPVIDYELKFVKRQFFYDNNKQKILKCIKAEFYAIQTCSSKANSRNLKCVGMASEKLYWNTLTNNKNIHKHMLSLFCLPF